MPARPALTRWLALILLCLALGLGLGLTGCGGSGSGGSSSSSSSSGGGDNDSGGSGGGGSSGRVFSPAEMRMRLESAEPDPVTGLPLGLTALEFRISGPGMRTIVQRVPVSGPDEFHLSFQVPAGPERTFSVQGLDVYGWPIYSGAQTVDLNGSPVNLQIMMHGLILNQPNLALLAQPGEELDLVWQTLRLDASDTVELYLRRPGSPATPDNIGCFSLGQAQAGALGARVRIPAGVSDAGDWFVELRQAASGAASRSPAVGIFPDQATHPISGSLKTASGTGLAGVSLSLSGPYNAQAVSDTTGAFRFPGFPAGEYLLEPGDPDYAFEPERRLVRVHDAAVTGQDFIGVPAATPAEPQGVAAEPGDREISISWQPAERAADYTLYWSTSPGVTPANGHAIANVVSPYPHTGLDNGRRYYYVVAASNAAGQGPASAEVSAVPRSDLRRISGGITLDGEPMASVRVDLFGSASAQTYTDAEGGYSFSVRAGQYLITPQESGYQFTPASRSLSVGSDDVTGQDFVASPAIQSFSVSGSVLRDGAGLAGVTVLLEGLGDPAFTREATTGSDGGYLFEEIPEGGYRVSPVLAGHTFEPPSREIDVAADTQVPDFIALSQMGTISGKLEGAMAGISGAKVQLAGGDVLREAVSDADGAYSFSDVPWGVWTVAPRAPGYTFLPGMRVVELAGPLAEGVDFAAVANTLSLGGSVTWDGEPLPDTTLTLTFNGNQRTTLTDNQGAFSFAELGPASYRLTPSKAGYIFTPSERILTLTDQPATGQDFSAAVGEAWTIAGVLSFGGSPVPGVTVDLAGTASAQTVSDPTGSYAFPGLADGAYSVTPQDANWLFTPSQTPVTLAGADRLGVNFQGTPLAPLYQISGLVRSTLGTPMQGVTVQLGGDASGSFITGTDGAFAWLMPAGAYTVTPILTGFSFIPAQSGAALPPDAGPLVFTGSENGFNILGNVSPASAENVAGILVQATPHPAIIGGGASPAGATPAANLSASAVTDDLGDFVLENLADGLYQVRPSRDGYAFTPPLRDFISLSGADVPGVDFTASFVGYNLAGSFQTPGGIGVGGVDLELRLGAATVATGQSVSDGAYIFSGLADGDYTVQPINPAYTYSPTLQPVTISGASVAGIDFTATPVTGWAVTGTVVESGPPLAPLIGVTLLLSGTPGTFQVQSDASGVYVFPMVPAGSYFLQASLDGYSFSPTFQNVDVVDADITVPLFDGVFTGYTLGGQIVMQGSGAPLMGVEVQVQTNGGGGVDTITNSQTDGAWQVFGLPNGTYDVTPFLAGYNFTPADYLFVVVDGASDLTLDFTATPLTPVFVASGTVTQGGLPVQGLQFQLQDAFGTPLTTAFSDINGLYAFYDLAAGSYFIVPLSAGTFVPTQQNVIITGGDQIGLDFDYTP